MFLSKIPPEVAGVGLAMFTSILRVIYDKKDTPWMGVILEALICGGLTLTSYSAIHALGLDPQWGICAGGVIGSLGSNAVRGIALRLINKRVD